MVLDELKFGAQEFVSYKYDLDGKVIMIDTVKILRVEDSHNLGLINHDVHINVSDTLPNMLTKSQVHKEVDSHVHEEVKDDSGIYNDSDHALDYVKSIDNEAICKNERVLLVCTSKNDMSSQNNED